MPLPVNGAIGYGNRRSEDARSAVVDRELEVDADYGAVMEKPKSEGCNSQFSAASVLIHK
jgi:hypothetical protein